MNSGDATSSEPSGHRPRGQQAPGGPPPEGSDAPPRWEQPTEAGAAPGQSYPPPGQSYPPPGQGYPPPGQGYPAPGQGYPAPGAPNGYAGYAGGGYPGGGYAGPPGPGGQPPLTPQEERTWAMGAHLSSILGVWVFFLGAVGPLVVLLTQGQRSAYVRAQAVEALNFNISVLIYSVIAWILVFILVGFILLAALFVFQVVFTVIAAVKTSNGESYRYPLTIRLVS